MIDFVLAVATRYGRTANQAHSANQARTANQAHSANQARTVGDALNRVFVVVAVLLTPALSEASEPEVNFVRDVKPILSDKCFACHGPDASNRAADLRLDQLAGATEDLGGYAAVVAGKPADSELIARITSSDPDLRMPPADNLKQLEDAEIDLLRRWIAQGAKWEEHWAYQPLKVRSGGPVAIAPEQRQWAVNFVDQLLLEKLSEEGMSPAAGADKNTLIRRLSMDLRGLPPTADEVREFVADEAPNATSRLVERFLADPAFGERMAIYWLDLVRYADTVGYHGDQDVSVSPFRDYVIDSFNSNKPFDEFTLEQLAGDLLDNPTQEQLVASGYNKLGMMSAEGGVQPKEYLEKYAADRVRTLSGAWLGSTVGCAECHDHKFDPFTAKDFYSFAAFFGDIKERGLYSGANRDGAWGPKIEVSHPALPELLRPIDERLAELDLKMSEPHEVWDRAQQQWESSLRGTGGWTLAKVTSAVASNGVDLRVDDEGHVLASGKNPATTTYRLRISPERPIGAIAIQSVPDDSLPSKGAGRAGNGNFVISEVEVFRGDEAIAIKSAVANHEQADANSENPYGGWKAAAAVDGEIHGESWGWAVLPRVNETNTLAIELSSVLDPGAVFPEAVSDNAEGAREEQLPGVDLVISQKHSNPQHTLGSFRIWVAAEWTGSLPADLPAEVRSALAAGPARSTQQQGVVQEYFRAQSELTKGLRAEVATLTSQRQQVVLENTRTTLITQTVEPREMRVLPRGNWMDRTGEIVQPAIPGFLRGQEAASPQDDTRLNRIDLAKWICSKENPLTARVFVNRLWKMYFGDGLSSSLDDFGAQGNPPEHARLLDALAIEFVRSGWDVKHMVRMMVHSSAYRQSSIPRPGQFKRDPYNRFFARQSRFRMPAELVRDNALAISGLLVRAVGGQSVKPYQPEGLYRHLNFPRRTYISDNDGEQFRRGVYSHWQRQFLHPALQSMDAPAREECTTKRPRSNTPLAALVLLNDPSFVEAARNLAQNVLLDVEPERQLDELFFQGLARSPRPEELAVLKRLLASNLAQFSQATEEAERLVSIGISWRDVDLDPVTLAAWTNVARAVLNMHEVITRN